MPDKDRSPSESPSATTEAALTVTGRALVLAAAFLGWFFAGILMSTTTLAMRSAAIDLLARVGDVDLPRFQELNKVLQQKAPGPGREASLPGEDRANLKAWRAAAQEWWAYFNCAMLFGAATGGLAFGRLGDRIGRSSALAASILCFSLLSGAAYFAQTPTQLLVLWFLAALGIGGVWPNGVALLSETWSNLSRPLVAGLMGTAANVGIYTMARLGASFPITPEHWRWVMLVGAAPVFLGLLVLVVVPESPRWLAARDKGRATGAPAAPTGQVFRPPFLSITLVGILLATIPLIGGWGSANWMVPWAAEAGETANPPNPFLQAHVGEARALTGIVGSLLGGWIAHAFGRRWAYCLVSVAALVCAQYTFWFLVPTDASFLFWVAALGFFSGIYFGWLPLFLPELFPTSVRSTGSGVSFNFGRILTAVTVFGTGALKDFFQGNYAHIGRVSSLIFVLGVVAVWLAPDTTRDRPTD